MAVTPPPSIQAHSISQPSNPLPESTAAKGN